ncbi:MAG: hypothetical protein A3E83_05895 [Gammaproteobacteria bacterium RIFCSPHIGHO2_12_FULL_41_20]|nr:MAG: hypothetical protein A3E83_05895 [Gammaproteobacteria bacterium RIFCSPHIGHO2_12_FULL_41_20]
MPQKKLFAALSLLSLLSIPAFAIPVTVNEHVIIAPQCLIKNSHGDYTLLASQPGFALITVNSSGIEQLIEAKHQAEHGNPCGGFVDVTHAWQSTHFTAKNASQFLQNYLQPAKSLMQNKASYSIRYPQQVKQIFDTLNPQAMWNNLTTLTNFNDRYANSDNGVRAANWLQTQVATMAKDFHRDDVTVYTVATGSYYKQPSVVVKFGNSSEPGVVIGGHMDTLSSTFSKKPGADDDGSGTVTVLETARAILSSNMHFKRPIYFIWYAAEEEGLVGSGHVVTDFKKKNIPVHAVMQLDMTGYAYKNQPDIWLIKDYVNKDLTGYLEQLINTYVKQPVKYTQCGYACSDHASWTQGGFVSAMPSESAFENSNHSIHTSQDTMEKLSLTHMTDYVKLAVAFAIELAEPVV